MNIKIFMPKTFFNVKENCDIFGETRICDDNSVSYYVLMKSSGRSQEGDNLDACKKLRHLGHIVNAKDLHMRDVALSFVYDEDTPNIYLHKLNIKTNLMECVSIFLYDGKGMLDLQMDKEEYDEVMKGEDELGMLYKLLRLYKDKEQIDKRSLRHFGLIVIDLCSFPMNLLTRIFMLLMQFQLIRYIFSFTSLYEHYEEWLKYYKSNLRKANIFIDRLLGIIFMILLLSFISNPGEYIIKASYFIIKYLRQLLDNLRGSPVGLKLNVHLNNFLLDCFMYHINLWEVFLILAKPFMYKFFLPIACIGCMGLSYQMALLVDLISVVGLHGHCFFIYSSVLYKAGIMLIRVLWKVVIGKRYNTLKNRVESYHYTNLQLFLATTIFATQVFLFPTIVVYYTVFTTLRLCIFAVNVILQFIRRCVLEFPLSILWKWFIGHFHEIHSLQLQYIDHVPSPLLQMDTLQMVVFEINVLSSSLNRVFSCKSGVLKDLQEEISLKSLFKQILDGTFCDKIADNEKKNKKYNNE